MKIKPEELEHRYIPNLIGQPFELTRAFVEKMHGATRSTILKDVLDNWVCAAVRFVRWLAALAHTDRCFLLPGLGPPQKTWSAKASKPKLCSCLLIELLAYQFASPVQWIATQQALVRDGGIRRFVEVGPTAVLTGMLQ